MKSQPASVVTMTTIAITTRETTTTWTTTMYCCMRQSFVQRLWLPSPRVNNNNKAATTNSVSATTLLACVGEIIVISSLALSVFFFPVSTVLAALVDFDTFAFLFFLLFIFEWFLLSVANLGYEQESRSCNNSTSNSWNSSNSACVVVVGQQVHLDSKLCLSPLLLLAGSTVVFVAHCCSAWSRLLVGWLVWLMSC